MKILTKIILISAVLCTMSGIVPGVLTDKTVLAENGYHEIVIEQSTGRILYENGARKKMPMASTTKIATCITAIENYSGFIDERVCVPDCAVGTEGSSLYLK